MTVSAQPFSGGRPILWLVLCACLWSTGGVLIKTTSLPPIAIAGCRSGIAAFALLIFWPKLRRGYSWRVLPGACAYAGTVMLFVTATKLTTAANAIFLQYTATIYIALLGPIILKERSSRSDWFLTVFALGGITAFFFDRLSLSGIVGIVTALASGFAFALLTIFLRQARNQNPVHVVVAGNLLAFVLSIPGMIGATGWGQSWSSLLTLGLLQLALPYLLYVEAIRRVRALDAAIITLLEPVLNPVWVLIFARERPSVLAMIGGVIVISAAVIRSVLVARRSAPPTLIGPAAIPD